MRCTGLHNFNPLVFSQLGQTTIHCVFVNANPNKLGWRRVTPVQKNNCPSTIECRYFDHHSSPYAKSGGFQSAFRGHCFPFSLSASLLGHPLAPVTTIPDVAGCFHLSLRFRNLDGQVLRLGLKFRHFIPLENGPHFRYNTIHQLLDLWPGSMHLVDSCRNCSRTILDAFMGFTSFFGKYVCIIEPFAAQRSLRGEQSVLGRFIVSKPRSLSFFAALAVIHHRAISTGYLHELYLRID